MIPHLTFFLYFLNHNKILNLQIIFKIKKKFNLRNKRHDEFYHSFKNLMKEIKYNIFFIFLNPETNYLKKFIRFTNLRLIVSNNRKVQFLYIFCLAQFFLLYFFKCFFCFSSSSYWLIISDFHNNQICFD